MNSFKRFSFPLLGALVAFLMVAGISSAGTVTLADLLTQKTYSLTEGGFDHDLLNPLVVTITNATWDSASQGDVRMNEVGGSTLSDLIRFVNVGGVATIYFGSDGFGGAAAIPTTGALSGPSPGFTTTVTETIPGYARTFTTTNGWTVASILTSGIAEPGGDISDHIQLTSTAPQVPEPSTFTLAGLGALGLIIRSYRRRRA